MSDLRKIVSRLSRHYLDDGEAIGGGPAPDLINEIRAAIAVAERARVVLEELTSEEANPRGYDEDLGHVCAHLIPEMKAILTAWEEAAND